ncbi:uncharacterized protein LOC110709090 [Chenopodium quinoa]|uniref:uncharacterized protein LOC110709090 n=1 Tax=Chenopodium quinoa TaxID=63459 RepID=UPI000B788CA9|nr:uncharacterized protein LOC110709090 [Chenopodium quinoa]
MDLHSREKDCIDNLKKWLKIDEEAWKQKSRIQWLSSGDSNSKFFFASVKQRRHINRIIFLYDDAGIKLTNPVTSLKRLWASIKIILALLLKLYLWLILGFLAPGLDGYNSVFFKKKTWNIVKDDIYAAAMDFFDNNKMCSKVNITAVTLVPKVKNASHVKSFRPIACLLCCV